MNIKKTLVSAGAAALVIGAFAAAAFASSSSNTNLLSNGNNWRVFNILPNTSQFWDINQAKTNGISGVMFPFEQFLGTNTGSFAVYLENNYNVDLTGKTLTASANWTPGSYVNRGDGLADAYARIEFQDVASGNYTSNDYWWYSGPGAVADLNDVPSSAGAILTAPLTDTAHWTNVCGYAANDDTVYPAGPNCVGGTDPAGSPSDGFKNAMKNVKEVNISFGRAIRYASGVAWNGDTSTQASFDLTSFSIQ